MMHTLPEVAAQWRLDETMRDPVRWLTRGILTGKLRARKVGRHWYMTAADIEHNLDRLANVTAEPAAPAPPVERPVGVPSLASMRRRRSA
jgi:hypothetical protein